MSSFDYLLKWITFLIRFSYSSIWRYDNCWILNFTLSNWENQSGFNSFLNILQATMNYFPIILFEFDQTFDPLLIRLMLWLVINYPNNCWILPFTLSNWENQSGFNCFLNIENFRNNNYFSIILFEFENWNSLASWHIISWRYYLTIDI